ncbi:hypothetical protein WR25_17296 [Diploscapter pachys]|uniref:Uncharacterized protein n=1 Tax=Diploscapter pachys TaxID=2018661 RepID=A0A2A2JYA6_9BILA|nr:hypothetical protein WR25_17296 [Diploscapter pachys]
MDSLHDRAPCLDLLVVPDARRQRIADCLRGDVGRLAYDDPRVSALRVIVGGEVGRNPVVVRTAPRQRRHDNAVAKRQVPDLDGLQYGRCGMVGHGRRYPSSSATSGALNGQAAITVRHAAAISVG